jgi:hypothetical protein
MSVFIFQSVPDRYDLRRELRVGKSDTWYATRYRNEMKVGDVVYFWMGGDQDIRGLYGWGNLTSKAYLKRNWDSHGVDVAYSVRFNDPFLARDLKNDAYLRTLLVLRAPQATNFLLTPEQASQLANFIHSRGEEAPLGDFQ